MRDVDGFINEQLESLRPTQEETQFVDGIPYETLQPLALKLLDEVWPSVLLSVQSRNMLPKGGLSSIPTSRRAQPNGV